MSDKQKPDEKGSESSKEKTNTKDSQKESTEPIVSPIEKNDSENETPYPKELIEKIKNDKKTIDKISLTDWDKIIETEEKNGSFIDDEFKNYLEKSYTTDIFTISKLKNTFNNLKKIFNNDKDVFLEIGEIKELLKYTPNDSLENLKNGEEEKRIALALKNQIQKETKIEPEKEKKYKEVKKNLPTYSSYKKDLKELLDKVSSKEELRKDEDIKNEAITLIETLDDIEKEAAFASLSDEKKVILTKPYEKLDEKGNNEGISLFYDLIGKGDSFYIEELLENINYYKNKTVEKTNPTAEGNLPDTPDSKKSENTSLSKSPINNQVSEQPVEPNYSSPEKTSSSISNTQTTRSTTQEKPSSISPSNTTSSSKNEIQKSSESSTTIENQKSIPIISSQDNKTPTNTTNNDSESSSNNKIQKSSESSPIENQKLIPDNFSNNKTGNTSKQQKYSPNINSSERSLSPPTEENKNIFKPDIEQSIVTNNSNQNKINPDKNEIEKIENSEVQRNDGSLSPSTQVTNTINVTDGINERLDEKNEPSKLIEKKSDISTKNESEINKKAIQTNEKIEKQKPKDEEIISPKQSSEIELVSPNQNNAKNNEIEKTREEPLKTTNESTIQSNQSSSENEKPIISFDNNNNNKNTNNNDILLPYFTELKNTNELLNKLIKRIDILINNSTKNEIFTHNY